LVDVYGNVTQDVGVWGRPNAPKPDEAPSGMRVNRDKAMTPPDINLYRS